VELPERITAWRKYVGMSVSALAEKCDVSAAAVYQWEAGETSPPIERIQQIAEAFDTTLAKFFGEVPKRKARAS
jgi:transcriptional regulator with XRE-family HTH domain